jgi:protein-S-isoprenylcysteine O-methyltransferase Ste14
MYLQQQILWRLAPLVHAGIFAALAVGRRLMVARGNNRTSVAFSRSESARDYVARHFYLWLPIADAAFLIFYAVTGNPGPAIVDNFSGAEAVRRFGAVSLVVSLIWVVISQSSMGASWRMGVDERERTELVTTGPFAVSRNPVYLGVRLSLLGQVLLIQTWPAVLFFAVCDLLAQIQVRFEEAHMEASYPESYAAYRSRVRRWI